MDGDDIITVGRAAPAPAGRLATGELLMRRSARASRVGDAARAAFSLAGSAATGYVLGLVAGMAGFEAVTGLASSLAACAATLALRIEKRTRTRAMAAATALPGGRRVAEAIVGALREGEGAALNRGGLWIVFEGPDADPKVMAGRDFVRYREKVASLVQIDTTGNDIIACRLTWGRLDSVASGKPAVEEFDLSGTRGATLWYADGTPCGMGEAMRAHAELEERPFPAPSA